MSYPATSSTIIMRGFTTGSAGLSPLSMNDTKARSSALNVRADCRNPAIARRHEVLPHDHIREAVRAEAHSAHRICSRGMTFNAGPPAPLALTAPSSVPVSQPTGRNRLAHGPTSLCTLRDASTIAGGGFEPPTSGLWARRATRLLYPAVNGRHYMRRDAAYATAFAGKIRFVQRNLWAAGVRWVRFVLVGRVLQPLGIDLVIPALQRCGSLFF